jgi:hypothetical protein
VGPPPKFHGTRDILLLLASAKLAHKVGDERDSSGYPNGGSHES